MSDDGRMQCAGFRRRHPAATESGATRSPLVRRVTSFRARRSTISGRQQATWDRLWPELGNRPVTATVRPGLLDTGAWFGRSRPGRAGDRLRHRHLDAGDGAGRTATSTSSPSRCTGAVWPSCSAPSTARHPSPTSGCFAATASTCSRTCSGHDSLTGVRVFFPDPWPKATPPQAPAAAARDRGADRRPASARRRAARRHRPRRVTPSRSPRSATPSRGCAGSVSHDDAGRCRSRPTDR